MGDEASGAELTEQSCRTRQEVGLTPQASVILPRMLGLPVQTPGRSIHEREENTGQTAAPKVETDRRIQGAVVNQSSLTRGNHRGTSARWENLNCDGQVRGGSVWTSLRVKNSRKTQSQGDPMFCLLKLTMFPQ